MHGRSGNRVRDAQHVEAEKSLVAQRTSAIRRAPSIAAWNNSLTPNAQEIARLHAEAEAARRARNSARANMPKLFARAPKPKPKLRTRRRSSPHCATTFQGLQEHVVARREELATMAERLASAEAVEQRLVEEIAQAANARNALRQQHDALFQEKSELESSCEQLAQQVEELRKEKTPHRRTQGRARKGMETKRARAQASSMNPLRGKRQSLDELRAERSQRQIEKARNDADRDYLRQTCVAELNAQPEELMAQEAQLLVGEDLIAAETNYNEMKARVEAMGPVNMMALEEFKECEQREEFLRRERDDLVQSIENTQLTINELDQVSRQKFEEAFNFINAISRSRSSRSLAAARARCGWASRIAPAKRESTSPRSRRASACKIFCCSPAAKKR